MATINLKRERWQGYFESVSGSLEGKQAFVEVAGLPLGDQVAAEWIPLQGITYDHKDDIVDLSLGDLDHIIRRPTAIHVLTEGSGVRSIEVVDAEGMQHIVRLREPLMLPKAG